MNSSTGREDLPREGEFGSARREHLGWRWGRFFIRTSFLGSIGRLVWGLKQAIGRKLPFKKCREMYFFM